MMMKNAENAEKYKLFHNTLFNKIIFIDIKIIDASYYY
jgi:hypothetical protein